MCQTSISNLAVIFSISEIFIAFLSILVTKNLNFHFETSGKKGRTITITDNRSRQERSNWCWYRCSQFCFNTPHDFPRLTCTSLIINSRKKIAKETNSYTYTGAECTTLQEEQGQIIVGMSAESEGVILSQSDVSIATLYQMFLCITLISFVFTLVLPKGLRRALLGSNKKRYVYSSWVKNAQITKTRIGKEIPKRENYVTLKEINTSDSLCFATLMDNDELSPLGESKGVPFFYYSFLKMYIMSSLTAFNGLILYIDCVEIGHGYQSIFRTKSAKKRTKSAKKPAPESSSKYHSIFDYNSPTDSVATSFVSTGIYSPPSEFFNEGEDNAGGTESAPPRIPLSERRELHSNITSQNVTGTPKLKTPAKMDYSPSPLSIVSTSFDGGLVVLIVGDKSIQDANENSSIELLRSKGLKYYIVDAMDPLQSKR